MANAQWQRILSAGLCPGINNFEEYEKRFVKQLNQAFENIRHDPEQVPDTEYIRDIHLTIFKDIVPWAGEFRKRGNVVTFDGGTLGTDAQAIPSELDQIATDTQRSLATATTDQDKAIALTLYQARMRRCHPFLDGNTRTGSCLLHGQVSAIFGQEIPRLGAHQSKMFKEHLALAYRGIIAPFTNNMILDPIGAELIEHVAVEIPKQQFIQEHSQPRPRNRDRGISD